MSILFFIFAPPHTRTYRFQYTDFFPPHSNGRYRVTCFPHYNDERHKIVSRDLRGRASTSTSTTSMPWMFHIYHFVTPHFLPIYLRFILYLRLSAAPWPWLVLRATPSPARRRATPPPSSTAPRGRMKWGDVNIKITRGLKEKLKRPNSQRGVFCWFKIWTRRYGHDAHFDPLYGPHRPIPLFKTGLIFLSKS